jgi:hypothetical protein
MTGGGPSAGLQRVRFFPRQLIGAEDLTLEQHYFRERLRRHNRYLHGWGVVCGCQVLAAPEADKPWQIRICPGYLLTPDGDEVRIGAEALFDLATCFVRSDDPCAYARPCPPVPRPAGQKPRTLYLAVRFMECQSRPVRVAPAGCGCDDAECEYSRSVDAYELCCLEQLPASHGQAPYGCDQLCQGGVFACPSHPADPWVVLATITPPTAASTTIKAADIHLRDRKLLYSTAMVQELALCACGPVPLPTPKVATPVITPASGTYVVWDLGVSMTVTTANATIFYTIDGTDPTTASNRYTGPFNVRKPIPPPHPPPTTVKARGVLAGFDDSDVARVDYAWDYIG